MARATNLNEGTADLVIKELRNVIIESLRTGRGVKVEGLGTWLPNIDLEGVFDVQYRMDNFLKTQINIGTSVRPPKTSWRSGTKTTPMIL